MTLANALLLTSSNKPHLSGRRPKSATKGLRENSMWFRRQLQMDSSLASQLKAPPSRSLRTMPTTNYLDRDWYLYRQRDDPRHLHR